MLPCVAQALASKSVRSRADRLIRLRCDDIVQLLFVLRGGDRVVGSLRCRLIGGRRGALLELGFVRRDHPVIVDLHTDEDGDEEQQDTESDQQRLDELGRDTQPDEKSDRVHSNGFLPFA